jgi:hypothetical protein
LITILVMSEIAAVQLGETYKMIPATIMRARMTLMATIKGVL